MESILRVYGEYMESILRVYGEYMESRSYIKKIFGL